MALGAACGSAQVVTPAPLEYRLPQPYEEIVQLDRVADAGKPMEVSVEETPISNDPDMATGARLRLADAPDPVHDMPPVDHVAATSQAPLTDLDVMLTEAGWPLELHAQATAVIWCESHGRPDAISATSDYGLFQIHAPVWAGWFGVEASAFLDPAFNARSALVIYQRAGGWGPWSCRPW